jgi:hypothetical protein
MRVLRFGSPRGDASDCMDYVEISRTVCMLKWKVAWSRLEEGRIHTTNVIARQRQYQILALSSSEG